MCASLPVAGEPSAPGSEPKVPRPLAAGLYIVAGPIGNLGDLSPRAAMILANAAVVAAEDTRVAAKLLRAAASTRPMVVFNDHSPEAVVAQLVRRMAGEAVALVSDAGTPLVSDPGFRLVRAARAAGVMVTTAPGPSAAIAALSIAGLPSNRFFFGGFLPPKAAARARLLASFGAIPATLIFYETGPRLGASLAAMAQAFGARQAVVLRELTKLHEEYRAGDLCALAQHYRDEAPRGEIVVLIAPPDAEGPADADAIDRALLAALGDLPAGKAAASVAAALGVPRGDVYARALALKAGGKDGQGSARG